MQNVVLFIQSQKYTSRIINLIDFSQSSINCTFSYYHYVCIGCADFGEDMFITFLVLLLFYISAYRLLFFFFILLWVLFAFSSITVWTLFVNKSLIPDSSNFMYLLSLYAMHVEHVLEYYNNNSTQSLKRISISYQQIVWFDFYSHSRLIKILFFFLLIIILHCLNYSFNLKLRWKWVVQHIVIWLKK